MCEKMENKEIKEKESIILDIGNDEGKTLQFKPAIISNKFGFIEVYKEGKMLDCFLVNKIAIKDMLKALKDVE